MARLLGALLLAATACSGLMPGRLAVAAEPDGEAAPLRLCADPDNLPFSGSNDATPGFYIEVGRAIAHELGRPFQPVWVPTFYTKRQVRQKLLAGQCDGFIGLPDDADFMGSRLIFSRPIATLGYALVTQPASGVTALDGLRGKRIAVQFDTPPQSLLATREDFRAVTVLSPDEAMRDLASGAADAAFIWGPSAGWANKTTMHDAYSVIPVAGEHLQWSAAIGFPRGNAALRDQVDGALGKITGAVDALATKYGFPGAPAAAVTRAADTQPATPPPPTPAVASPEEAAAGHKLFNDNCAHCHGPDAVQGERRRNLRLLRARYGDDMPQAFLNTVTHGRVSKGMPNWSGILTDDEFHKILAFLSSVQESGPQ